MCALFWRAVNASSLFKFRKGMNENDKANVTVGD